MLFEPGSIDGAFVVSLEPRADERGFFARAFCTDEFTNHGLEPAIEQMNFSHNPTKGTLRGMHWQEGGQAEAKFIRCIRGAIFDVIVDMRPESSTYRQWMGVELSQENRKALYAPPGTAHGYLTLADDTDVFYSASQKYAPGVEHAGRYDDPAIGIAWPMEPALLSDKDRSAPDFP